MSSSAFNYVDYDDSQNLALPKLISSMPKIYLTIALLLPRAEWSMALLFAFYKLLSLRIPRVWFLPTFFS